MAAALRSTQQAQPVRRAVVCAAQKEDSQVSKAVAAAALATVLAFGQADAAKADISGLTPCSESKAYAKRLKNEVKALNKRLKNYEADSAPAIAIKATIDRTEKRFANYAKAGLLCGADGLPHLISDPGLALKYGHAGETFIPTIGFLYIAGWIGYVGRLYLNKVKTETKPTEKEIIIDVPAALKLTWQGATWPVQVVAELKANTLVEKAENITVSPR
ncbi:chloroplast photosystem I reaction center subunit III [Scenedesmus sp. NREL 46B-D3]|nr:chloroplast photosystem I reaction center subunit III [Scenedesmus sp. NREL 46B-D3]